MSDQSLKIGLGAARMTNPLSGDFATDRTLNSVFAAAKGGAATVNYFNNANQTSKLFQQLIQGGVNAWETAEDENGLPIYYIKSSDGAGNSYYISMQANLTVDSNGDLNPNDTTQTINGVTFNGIGALTMSIGYNNSPTSQVLWWLGMTSVGAVGFSILKSIIKGCIDNVASQYAAQIANIGLGDFTDPADLDDSISEADSDASTAITEGTEGTVEIEISLSWSFIGIGLGIAAVFIVLSFIFHSSAQRVRLWNVTRYKAIWSLYFDEGKLVSGPVEFNSDSSIKSYTPFIPVCSGSPVPGALPVNQAMYGDISFNSNSQTNGIGYAMQIQLVDDQGNVKYTCTLMFDIPLVGKNSTSVTFNTVSSLSDYYNNQAGVNNSIMQQAVSSDNLIQATTTYDYLDGEHPMPQLNTTDTNEGYFYQSLILLAEQDLTAANIAPCGC
ncbi:hypothetical protein [Methylobacterium sp. SyP6R]|uniref:hypothetical protein n=1 Tax=Methylobacterium sp. SyP6R TaxID=2718876 RepID=UPI001F2F6D02|nr:hypothetical protein [Methylobacterium sp. SyP6R]MCF4129191.1 hypothetical protein [Methylobacterium sp. SyP6R]